MYNSNQVYTPVGNYSQKVITKQSIYKYSCKYLKFVYIAGIISGIIAAICCLLLGAVGASDSSSASAPTTIVPFATFFITVVLVIFLIIKRREPTVLSKRALDNNQFIIYVDMVGGKKAVPIRRRGIIYGYIYQIYLSTTYSKYGFVFNVSKAEYNSVDIGDEYFVACIVPTYSFNVFLRKEYSIDPSLQEHYVDISQVENIVKPKNFNIFKNNNNQQNSNYQQSNYQQSNYQQNNYQQSNYQQNNYQPNYNQIISINEYGVFNAYKKYDVLRKPVKTMVICAICFFIFGLTTMPLAENAEVAKNLLITFAAISFLFVASVFIPILYRDNIVKNAIIRGDYILKKCVIQEDVTYRNVIEHKKFRFFRVNEFPMDIKGAVEDFSQVNVGDYIYVFSFYHGQVTGVPDQFAALNPKIHQLSQSILYKMQ